ncbi:MAG: glycosyltransferase family 1 protein [Alphaproteobacteria bacterium]|nr:glycosyltransferase family 1 protein [Alphaproteobacteria bacterium]
MTIGFDAKRAFHNTTGLGNYSRTLIQGLLEVEPSFNYILFTPKPKLSFLHSTTTNIKIIEPQSFMAQKFSSLWRLCNLGLFNKDVRIDLFHGLTNELPICLPKKLPKIVTVHDIIFEFYPEFYPLADRMIHRAKIKHACKIADIVMTDSFNTKNDLINYYFVPEEKIKVCFLSYNQDYIKKNSTEALQSIQAKYNLPQQFFLYVGTIEPRKNLLLICQALNLLKNSLKIPLVVVGHGKKYFEYIQQFLAKHHLTKQVIFLNYPKDKAYQPESIYHDLPAIYQLSTTFIYPSLYEGFGLPILEAMASGVPVITTKLTSLPEVAGSGAIYVHPLSAESMAQSINDSLDLKIRQDCLNLATTHIKNFEPIHCTNQVLNIYKLFL